MTHIPAIYPPHKPHTGMILSRVSKTIATVATSILITRNTVHLSDQLARDMGLTSAEIERHRLQLPSQSNTHPML